jgi:hypothetical protein
MDRQGLSLQQSKCFVMRLSGCAIQASIFRQRQALTFIKMPMDGTQPKAKYWYLCESAILMRLAFSGAFMEATLRRR